MHVVDTWFAPSRFHVVVIVTVCSVCLVCCVLLGMHQQEFAGQGLLSCTWDLVAWHKGGGGVSVISGHVVA